MKQFKEALKEIILESLFIENKGWRFHNLRRPKLVYKEKQVKVDSDRHRTMLERTLAHLIALRDIYPVGSANRHIISQSCTRIKRLLNKIEKISLEY